MNVLVPVRLNTVFASVCMDEHIGLDLFAILMQNDPFMSNCEVPTLRTFLGDPVVILLVVGD